MSANDRQPGGDHYSKKAKVQHWDLMSQHNVGYLEGNASKYAYRFENKAGDLDLQKCDHYVEKMIDMIPDGYVCRGHVPFNELLEFCNQHQLSPKQTDLMLLLLSEWTLESLEAARNVIADLRQTYYPQAK